MPERRRPFKSSPLFVLVFVGAAMIVSFGGCATKRDLVVAKGRGGGTERLYPVTADQAWIIAKTILELEPTEKIEEHRSEGYMVTSDVVSVLAPSTFMGVFVESAGPGEAKVRFVTRRRTPTQAYAALTEPRFHAKFAELVKLVAAVGPLPSRDGPAGEDRSLTRPSSSPSDAGAPPPDAPEEGRADGGS